MSEPEKTISWMEGKQMSDQKYTQNQVRQVLMNEMGLTRESVRKEVIEIVTTTVDSFLGSTQFRKSLSDAIISVLSAKLKEFHCDQYALKRIVQETVATELAGKFEVTLKIPAK